MRGEMRRTRGFARQNPDVHAQCTHQTLERVGATAEGAVGAFDPHDLPRRDAGCVVQLLEGQSSRFADLAQLSRQDRQHSRSPRVSVKW